MNTSIAKFEFEYLSSNDLLENETVVFQATVICHVNFDGKIFWDESEVRLKNVYAEKQISTRIDDDPEPVTIDKWVLKMITPHLEKMAIEEARNNYYLH